jgi:hypothetical protein
MKIRFSAPPLPLLVSFFQEIGELLGGHLPTPVFIYTCDERFQFRVGDIIETSMKLERFAFSVFPKKKLFLHQGSRVAE